MLSTAHTFTLDGISATPVRVEVDLHRGLPGFAIVGLPDAAARATRERVRAALVNCGFEFPLQRIVVNLAPANLRKAGPGMDLAIAAALLTASGQLESGALARIALFGELGLDGTVRPILATMVLAEAARAGGFRAAVVPAADGPEAALAEGIEIVAITSVAELPMLAAGGRPAGSGPVPLRLAPAVGGPDLADLRGQTHLRLALEIAAAGGHSLFMIGPPGSGKSAAAIRLPAILPPLTEEEAREVGRIASLTGRLEGGAMPAARPFRAPHHTISAGGLLGGGSPVRPGEVTMAHRGCLYLDSPDRFRRDVLEALWSSLGRHQIRIASAAGMRLLPSWFLLVAASDPCPCGRGEDDADCTCRNEAVRRHRDRLKAALGGRFDLVVKTMPPSSEEIAGPPGESSATVRDRVCAARARQAARLGRGRCNSEMSPAEVGAIEIDPGAARLLDEVSSRRTFGARARRRTLGIARTVADLAGAESIDEPAVRAALELSHGVGELR